MPQILRVCGVFVLDDLSYLMSLLIAEYAKQTNPD